MVKVKESLVGKQFDRLIVIEQVEDYVSPKGKHRAKYLCKCSCCEDKYITVVENNLKNGSTCSCGCFNSEKIIRQNKKYNDYEIQEDYVIMYDLNNKSFYVDLDDFWKVKDICWHVDLNGYVIGWTNGKDVGLHRFITNCPDSMDVDHINHDTTDNRKKNLRIATRSQNMMNRGLQDNNTSGVTGVYWNKGRKKWEVQIGVNSKTIFLGHFTNFDDAVKARKEAENKYFGEFSYDNSQTN